MKRFLSSVDSSRTIDAGPVVDCHQHLWPQAFIEELRRRTHGPRLVGWELHLDGEPPYAVNPADHDLSQRRRIDEADEVDLALLSLSAPLGIETMDPDEAAPLLDAFHTLADDVASPDDAAAVGAPVSGYGVWASVSLVEPDLNGLAALLKHPRIVGLQVPATAMLAPALVERLAPVLAVVEAADLPVLVHPGPASVPEGVETEHLPRWWPALTSYTAQLTASWMAWHAVGRSLLPRLRIVFAGLSGLAPLHHERLVQRGGDFGPIDRFVYYETSSYGLRAVDAMVRVVGVDPIVHGSDRPYATPTDPGLGDAFAQALFVNNPAHLLTGGAR